MSIHPLSSGTPSSEQPRRAEEVKPKPEQAPKQVAETEQKPEEVTRDQQDLAVA